MRTRTSFLIGALLLASAGLAQAQDQQQQTTNTAQTTATPASSFTPKYGQVDFGFRGDSLSGDEARYNRFRDLRNGAYLDRFRLNRETQTWFFNAEANNVGYRDQRYLAEFQSIGKLKASFEWNQTPLFISTDTRSLWSNRGNGVLAIDDGIQQALQTASGLGNAVRDVAIANALGSASRYDMRNSRDTGLFNLVYTVNRDVDVKFNVKSTNRTGFNLLAFGFGTSPGLNPAVELGVPMDDRTTDFTGGIEFANAKGLLAFGYTGSWYENSIPFVRFDNPLRAVDIAGGASQGLAAMWPSNSSFAVNTSGSYKFGRTTRANALISIGRWTQDETLPAPTINTALVAPPLMRSTADTRADIVSMVYNINSRPVGNVWLNARYRYYDYANKTAHFEYGDHAEKLALLPIGDWSLTTQFHEIEPASFKRQNLDLDASFSPSRYIALGAGYGREDGERSWRIFEKTVDDSVRFTVDSTGNDYVSLRLKYEYSTRSGSGFDGHLLEEVGEQPETRHYDIADRDRSRFTTTLTVTPVGFLSLNGSVGTGKDDYKNTGFGLRDNENNNWSAGLDIVPNDVVSFGVNYGYEKMTAYQYSRTSNPLPNPTFNDPTRDWWLDSDDEVKTVSANLDLTKALPKTDIRLGYDLSDGKATYVYGLPSNQTVFTAAAPLSQLAPLKNRLSIGRFDVQHFVRPNVALGVAYHFEEYKVDDFALDSDALNRLDPANGTTGVFASTIYSGYLYRPYTAHTWWLRMTYLW